MLIDILDGKKGFLDQTNAFLKKMEKVEFFQRG